MPAAFITSTIALARLHGASQAQAYAAGNKDADKCPLKPGSPEAIEWQSAWDAEFTSQNQGFTQ